MNTLSHVPALDEVSTIFAALGHKEINTILWDLDGTILNTEKYHVQALLESMNITEPRSDSLVSFLEKNVGVSDTEFITALVEQEHTALQLSDFKEEEKAEIFIQEVQKNQDVLNPRLHSLLKELSHQGFTLGVVTSSSRADAHFLLKHFKLSSLFSCVVTLDDITYPKPDPGPYLKGLQLLEADDKRTIVFEDSAVGLLAAKKAGLSAIKVSWY